MSAEHKKWEKQRLRKKPTLSIIQRMQEQLGQFIPRSKNRDDVHNLYRFSGNELGLHFALQGIKHSRGL